MIRPTIVLLLCWTVVSGASVLPRNETKIEQPSVETTTKPVAASLHRMPLIKIDPPPKPDKRNISCDEYCSKKPEDVNRSSCNQGCRLYVISLTLADKTNESVEKSQAFQSCSKACGDIFEIETDNYRHCNSGCQVEFEPSQQQQQSSTPSNGFSISNIMNTNSESENTFDEIEDERNEFVDNEEDFDQRHRPFSIIVPMLRGNEGHESDPRPSMLNVVLSLMRSMSERAREMFEHQQAQQQMLERNGNSDTPSGISVQRSMFLMMSKDQDGHRKIVYSGPKVFIQRVISNPFERTNEFELNAEQMDPKARLNQLELEMQNHVLMDKNEKFFDEPKKTIHVRTWPSCVYVLLPRLFYLILIIMVIYIVFWLFYTIPAYFYRPRDAIIPVSQANPRRKFFFDGNQKYFKLKCKLNSLSQSLTPPPYSECIQSSPVKKASTPEGEVPYVPMEKN